MRNNLFRRSVPGILVFMMLFSAGQLTALAQSKDQQPPQAEPQQTPGFSISITVPVVSVDVVVTDNNGNYLTGLKKENFRITEDGTTQTITNFATSEAPITIVLLLEFSRLGYQIFTYNARNWSAAFLNTLKPSDWVALETFNMRPNIEVDFTHSRDEVMRGLYQTCVSAVQRIESFRCACGCSGPHEGRQRQEGGFGARFRDRHVQQDEPRPGHEADSGHRRHYFYRWRGRAAFPASRCHRKPRSQSGS